MTTQIYSAVDVADEFLKLAKREGQGLTPMQLVKLTYIAKGWALAILNRNLFSERTEAWKYGPVIPDLYHVTKKYGRSPIPMDKVDDQSEPRVDTEVLAFLKEVFGKYGNLSGSQLSSLTHKVGSPWHQVYNPDEMHIEIPDALIETHYRRKLDERESSSTA